MAALVHMLRRTRPRVLLVRRCNELLWASERMLQQRCSAKHGCSQPLDLLVHRGISERQLLAEAASGKDRDLALKVVINASQTEVVHFNSEWLDEETNAAIAKQTLMDFLGAYVLGPIISRGHAPMRNISATSVGGHPNSVDSVLSHACRVESTPCDTTNCSWRWATKRLATFRRPQRPMLVVSVHWASGGASVIGKLMTEACRAWLTPQFGIRCSLRDGYENCDPTQVDLCVQRNGHFSAGKLVDREYRIAHVVRDPLDVIIRSYLTSSPNASALLNSSVLLTDLEAHLRVLLAEDLREMQAMSDRHVTDPRYLRIRFEDLETPSTSQRNTTLERMFNFLLDDESAPISIPASITVALHKALQKDGAESSQRKHLQSLLQRKPAKCHHIGRLQVAMEYPAMLCT